MAVFRTPLSKEKAPPTSLWSLYPKASTAHETHLTPQPPPSECSGWFKVPSVPSLGDIQGEITESSALEKTSATYDLRGLFQPK